jgi:transposase
VENDQSGIRAYRNTLHHEQALHQSCITCGIIPVMVKDKKSTQPPKMDVSEPDTLRGLDEETLVGIISRLVDQNRQLSELLQAFLQEKYGPKTERFVDPNQLRLFGPGQEEVRQGSEQAAGTRPKKSGTPRERNPRPSNLPRVRVPAKNLTAEDLICKCCGKSLVRVNEIVLHRRYNYKPASVCLEEVVEEVLACPDCDQGIVASAQAIERAVPAEAVPQQPGSDSPVNWLEFAGTSHSNVQPATDEHSGDPINAAVALALATTHQAAARIARCEAGAGMLSYIAISKYCDHLPLYRLEQIFAREGADIPRSTMCGWLSLLCDLLRGLYDLMHAKLLLSRIIKTDDTPIKVLDRLIKKKIKIGRMWVYLGDKDHPFIVFNYTPGRSRAGPKNFLRGFKMYLQGDCFSGNEAICAENGAILVACNAHARRYFKKALLNYRSKSEEALRIFQQLFDIEHDARDLELKPADVKLMREQESKPILDAFKKWLDKEHTMALPKSSFGKAVSYCLNNWQALKAYLSDGELTIDNNESERQMKRIAMGRKAWLFYGSDNGGERAEVLLSLIETCKMHGVEPWAYLKDVVETLVANPAADLEQLLPTTWKPRSEREQTEIPHVMDTPKVA